jgi:hypothetical protein
VIGRLPLALAVLLVVPGEAAARRLPKSSRPVSVVLVSAHGEERVVEVRDFRFAYFERIFYDRRTPRDQDASGRRTEVEDRRHECLCLKLQDWSEIQFRLLRQIEVQYPEGGPSARVRVTRRTGEVREYPIEALYGGVSSFAPRFAATIDGRSREFPLAAGEGAETWPAERLARVLFVPPKRAAPPVKKPRLPRAGKKPGAPTPEGGSGQPP